MSCETPLQKKMVNSFLPYPNECLTDHVLKKAEKELGETLETQGKALMELKNKLKGKWNPDELSFEDVKKLYLILCIQVFRDPMAQINGLKVVFDFEGTCLHHLRHTTWNNLYFLYHLPLNCCPARLKGIHFVNQTVVLTVGWKIISPFLSRKIRKRCHFHSDARKLLEFFPPSMLPTKVGGDLSDVDSTELMRRLNMEQQNHPIEGQCNFY